MADASHHRLYRVLEVSPDAGPEAIRRSYYRLAVRYHPDKNPPETRAVAEQRFKEISEAYQVLSDPTLRKQYDQYGDEVVTGSGQFTDARTYFKTMFGLDRFADIIGDLEGGDANERDVSVLLEEKARQKAHLVQKLVDKLDALARLGTTDANGNMIREAEELAKSSPFAPSILYGIGHTYYARARHYLTRKGLFGLQGVATNLRDYGHLFGSIWSTARAYAKVHEEGQRVRQLDDATAKPDDNLFNRFALNGILLHSEVTLKTVADRAVADHSVAKEVRVRRAELLQRLGQLYMARGRPAARD